MNIPKAPSLLGIGNALVDIMTQLDSDEKLKTLELPKGSMTLVDEEKSEIIDRTTQGLKKEVVSGGSVANTCYGLGKLGVKVGYLGKVGKDAFGEFYEKELKEANVIPEMLYGNNPTGKAMALVSTDGERTFGTYLGAAVQMDATELKPEMFEGYDYFHIEGYLVFNQALIQRAAELAKECGLTIAIDLASYNVVEANLDFLRNLIDNYVDIVFANEEEAKAISGLSPEETVHWLAERTEIAVVKLGKDGSLIKKEGELFKVEAGQYKCIDTTGAGDLYASGFFYGLLKGLSMTQCAQIASVLAGNVIENFGARIDNQYWNEICQEIKKIEG